MKNVAAKGACCLTFLFTINFLILTLFFSANAKAQSGRAADKSVALFEIKTKGAQQYDKGGKKNKAIGPEKIYKSKSNLGRHNGAAYFPQLISIQPGEKIPVTVTYPEGKRGEKVSVLTMDGGTFDNGKIVKTVALNSQNQVSFNFNATTNEGIYRLILQKGNDTKVIQLWAGKEIPARKK